MLGDTIAIQIVQSRSCNKVVTLGTCLALGIHCYNCLLPFREKHDGTNVGYYFHPLAAVCYFASWGVR